MNYEKSGSSGPFENTFLMRIVKFLPPAFPLDSLPYDGIVISPITSLPHRVTFFCTCVLLSRLVTLTHIFYSRWLRISVDCLRPHAWNVRTSLARSLRCKKVIIDVLLLRLEGRNGRCTSKSMFSIVCFEGRRCGSLRWPFTDSFELYRHAGFSYRRELIVLYKLTPLQKLIHICVRKSLIVK